MKKNLPLVLLCVIAGIATMAAGNWYWMQKKGDFFRRLYARKTFNLMDGDGKIFSTKDFPKDHKTLLVFTPDTLPVAAVKPFRILLSDFAKARNGVNIVVVSRVHGDIVKNFLRAAGFRGKILLDPFGGLGQYLGAWASVDSATDWTLMLVDHELVLSWSFARKEVPEYKEIREKF